MEKESKDTSEILDPKTVRYCQAASEAFLELIDDSNGDWRSARAVMALETGLDPDSRSPVQMGGLTDQKGGKKCEL